MLIFMKDTNLGGALGRLVTQDRLFMNFNNEYHPIFNMSSIYNLGIRLPNLIPLAGFGGQKMNLMDDRGFDIYYANYIINHLPAFIDMMTIMYEIYLTGKAVVLIGDNEYKDYLSDSLMKFIQQRYEYPIHIVVDVDDIPERMVDDYHFTSVLGLSHFDDDREKYHRCTLDPDEINAQYQAILRGEEPNGY